MTPFGPSLSRRDATRELARLLSAAGVPTPELDARLLCAAALDLPTVALLLDPDAPLGERGADRLSASARRRLDREPVARILGRREFWSLPFAIGPDTLEPRPDTETVVAAALARIPDRSARLRVLDLGSGSGCLLVALLHELPSAWGLGVDRSVGALATARANARSNGVDARCAFVAADWTAPLRGAFDMIVSNPPYIAGPALAELAPEVGRFDPPLALDGGPDGLEAYRAILPALRGLLAPNGFAALEIGCDQAEAVTDLARVEGLDAADPARDLAGLDRALVLS